jgi:nucleoside-diphosphate-sugar epimerase
MNILITGNMGYVGPAVTRHLRARCPDARIVGYDTGYFGHCLTAAATMPETLLDAQYFGDVRDIPAGLFDGVDAVVHLAAVSNDPMGNRFEAVTNAINFESSLRVAELAKSAAVRNYVFASSCSVYGAGGEDARTEQDAVNPLTAYARSKIDTEHALAQMQRSGMIISCLRFATACGMSDRLRLDLVLNDFVANALATGKITVLSDGSPWRPLIDVADMARALEWAVRRTENEGGGFLTVNAGSNQWNYQVRDLAEAVARLVPDTVVEINSAAPPDKRSYRVDFSLFARLAPDHAPQVTLEDSIQRLSNGLRGMWFADADFRNSPSMRLKVLEAHIANGRLDEDLRWTRGQGNRA